MLFNGEIFENDQFSQFFSKNWLISHLHIQNEKDYLNHYNEFLHMLDFKKLFKKILYAILVFEILNNNIYLYLIDSNQLYHKPGFIILESYIV